MWLGSLCTSGLRTSNRHLQLDWTGRSCGLASQVTEPHINGLLTMRPYSPYNAGIKSLRATLPDEIFYWSFCFLNRVFR
jgi:hypothetical protein